MPSASLHHWRNDRMPRLVKIDVQCAAALTLTPPEPDLVDESLRGYVLLLSAHFQGFCRELNSEAALIITSKVRPGLMMLIQQQVTAHRRLDRGNPTIENLKANFERFGFTLDLASADPANPARVIHLAELNQWRNVAAHHGTILPGIPLTLPTLQAWRLSCDGLATSLDRVLYNQLRRLLRRSPWVP